MTRLPVLMCLLAFVVSCSDERSGVPRFTAPNPCLGRSLNLSPFRHPHR